MARYRRASQRIGHSHSRPVAALATALLPPFNFRTSTLRRTSPTTLELSRSPLFCPRQLPSPTRIGLIFQLRFRISSNRAPHRRIPPPLQFPALPESLATLR